MSSCIYIFQAQKKGRICSPHNGHYLSYFQLRRVLIHLPLNILMRNITPRKHSSPAMAIQ